MAKMTVLMLLLGATMTSAEAPEVPPQADGSLAVAREGALEAAQKPSLGTPCGLGKGEERAAVSVKRGGMPLLVATEHGDCELVAARDDVRIASEGLRPGQKVILGVALEEGRPTVTRVVVPVPLWMRAGTVAGVAIALLVLALLLVRARAYTLIVGQDNRYSNSKTQMALWFWVLLTAYLATVFVRVCLGGAAFVTGLNIPDNLLFLSGFSGVTFAAAKGITVARGQKPSPADAPEFSDLVTNDLKQADLGDFQMLVVTAVAAGIYLVQILYFLKYTDLSVNVSLPDVDRTLLTVFGLGQGSYLAKKLASRPGEG